MRGLDSVSKNGEAAAAAAHAERLAHERRLQVNIGLKEPRSY